MGEEKLLLAYLCLFTQLCLGTGVQGIPGVDDIIKPTNTTDLVLIRNATNPLANQEWHGMDMLAEMFRQGGQPNIAEDTETSAQTETI